MSAQDQLLHGIVFPILDLLFLLARAVDESYFKRQVQVSHAFLVLDKEEDRGSLAIIGALSYAGTPS